MTCLLRTTCAARLVAAAASILVPLAAAADEPAAAALHPQAAAGLALPYAGTPIDVTTFHYDGLRTGWNAAETDLTQASVKSAKFGLLKTIAVDGLVLAQPLLVSNFKMADGSTHDVLLVVTAHNSVYALDAQSYATLWQVNLGPSQSSNDVGCSHVTPEYGILATPVVVRSGSGSAAVYLVSATEPTKKDFHTFVHALNLASGAAIQPAVEIAASTTLSDGTTLAFNRSNQWIRSGLAFANNSVYVAASSHCDQNAGRIAGWVLRYGTDLTLKKAFSTIETPAGTELAAIWMSGFAPAVDTSGNVFAVTGNGNFAKGGKDWGESAIRLPPTLDKVADFFTPAAYRNLNSHDTDFGSGGIMLLPVVAGQSAPPMAVALGKDPTIYLLNRNNLGKVQAGDAGALQALAVPGNNGLWGGPAYFGGPAGGVVYYQVGQGPLQAYAVATGATPSLTPTVKGTVNAGSGGSMPVVSSNGSAAGTGVVWVVHRGANLTLEAYDAERLGAPLFSAPAGSWSPGKNDAYISPMVANGRVYVGGYQTVDVFGLTP